jgi:predicted ATPase
MATAPSVHNNDATTDDRTKPPFLHRVRIRGYKSIPYCDVILQPLTILVGRNGAGKSNFLDALMFLRDLMERRATDAVYERKGWRSIHCRTGSTPIVEMGVEGTFESFQSTWNADYSFSLETFGQNQIRVQNESLILSQIGRDRRCGYRLTGGNREWIGLEHFEDASEWTPEVDVRQSVDSDKLEDPRLFRHWRNDRLLLSVIGTQPFVDFAERLRASCVYNFHPPSIRVHQPIMASPILTREGSNLARAIEGIREIEPETVQRIEHYLKAIVPDIIEFSTQEYGDFETVRFSLKTKGNQSPLEFDASSMSDGTLRVLAALVGAFQIVLPSGFPGFIGIEEPETALHPAATRALVDALQEATERTQVLLTTHSGDLLTGRDIDPSQILVVRNWNGQTQIAPVDAASREIVRKELYTLADLQRMDQLELDEDDLKRQAESKLRNGEG